MKFPLFLVMGIEIWLGFFLLKRVKLLFVLVMQTLFLRVVFLFLSCFEIIGFLMSLILIFNDSKRELLGCRINETEL